MEALRLNQHEGQLSVVPPTSTRTKKTNHFIDANTVSGSLEELRLRHVVPTYADSVPLISHADFIETVQAVTEEHYSAERILSPEIRLSHPFLGRIPEARNKPVSELLDHEKTLFYQRCAFIIEVPSISDTIDGQALSLTIGGVRGYDQQNLGARSNSDQHFKLFIGWKVKVCCNLSVFSDGVALDVRVKDLDHLTRVADDLVSRFDAITQLKRMEELQDMALSEQQFVQLIGRCKLYQHVTNTERRQLPEFQFGEQHLSAICRDYYTDPNFGRAGDGSLSLWRLYNLLTSAARSSYIDAFLERTLNASRFTASLSHSLREGTAHWFLN